MRSRALVALWRESAFPSRLKPSGDASTQWRISFGACHAEVISLILRAAMRLAIGWFISLVIIAAGKSCDASS